MSFSERRCATTARVLAVALATASFAAAGAARAADDDAEGRATELKTQGDQAMEAGSYGDALNAYKTAYTIAPDPALLYNLGRAQERLGMYPEALRNVEQFSRIASADLKARVPHLADLLTELRAHVALVTVRCNVDGARVMLRGHYVASTPAKWAIATTPGKAPIEVQADGYAPWDRSVSLDEGKTTAVDVTLVPKERASTTSLVAGAGVAPSKPKPKSVLAAAPTDRDSGTTKGDSGPVTSKWWFWTGIGVGVVGGVALTAALLTQRSAPSGDMGQVSAPLTRF